MNAQPATASRTMVLLGFILLATLATVAFADAPKIRRIAPAALAPILTQPLPTPASGSSNADVTVVEYFDYNCPVCQRMEPALRQLLASDARVRLIHKDWPIFGEASTYAALCSLAAAREGKYQQAHDALIGSKQDLDSSEDVRKVLQQAGFDLQKIDSDIALHQNEYSTVLARNVRETTALGLRGTPGLIIGNQLVPGGLDYPQLVRLVAEARNAH